MQEEIDVLLVEDNPNDAELTLEALSAVVPASRIRHVEDGVAALEEIFGPQGFAELGRKPPRVVILDMKLPKVDGIEVLRKLKADARTRLVPVVMLTSSKEIGDVSASYGAGVNSYLVKPVAYEEYLERVTQAARYWLKLNEPPVER